MSSALPIETVYYPDSDGRPMAESDLHRDEMVREINILQRYYAGQTVYVSGNLLVYYEEGNPKKCFAPDVLVAKGIRQRRHRTYQIWLEQVVPQVVIEVTSKKTKKQDMRDKFELYAELGINEYFLFDPSSDYLSPNLQGYRLMAGRYERIPELELGVLVSEELELKLVAEKHELAFFRLNTGERLLTSEEARVEEVAARLVAEKARAAAEAETARLREELRLLTQH